MIADPNLPAPTDQADALELLHIGGVECLSPAMAWLEANDPAHQHTLQEVHRLLTRAGYMLEEAYPGLVTGAAGGGGKGGGGW